MGTYNIPRDTKGEGRLFYIFSTKALIYTVAGILLGVLFKWLLGLLGNLLSPISGILNFIGVALIVIFALLGFAIGTFKVPNTSRFEITRKAGGINIDKVLIESIKFKFKKNKHFIYDTEELVREDVIREMKEEQEEEEKFERQKEELIRNDLRNRRGYIK